MANKKSKAKNPNTPAARAKALAEAEKNKINYVPYIIGAAAMLLTAGIITLIILLSSPKARADRFISRAEDKLLSTPYKLVLATGADSTDADLNEILNTDVSTVTLTVDGDAFRFVDPLGDGQVIYHYFDGTLYIDESVINICTKSEIPESELAALRDKYVTPYITVFDASDYRGADIEKDKNGNVTITLKNLTSEREEELEKSLLSIVGSGDDKADMGIDRDETKTVIMLDSEGRFKSIEQRYAFSVTYSDGYSALITMDASKEYSYGDAIRLGVPAGVFIDSENAYKNLFGTSFEVTTNTMISTDDTEALNRFLAISSVFGNVNHNILRVDGNNYECTYPNINAPEEGEELADGVSEVWSIVGDTLYLNSTYTANGSTTVQKIKQQIDDKIRTTLYESDVMSNIFPSYARDYIDIKIETDGEGITTVTCQGLTESIYNAVNEAMNYNYISGLSPIRMIPRSELCSYILEFDSNGMMLSTELMIVAAPNDVTTSTVYENLYFVVQRIFDYEVAEDYYESVGIASDPWIVAPSDADDYESGVIY